MAKQKSQSRKIATHRTRHKIPASSLHRRRAAWFTMLVSGLIIIQLAYNWRSSGHPQVLGYATNMSTAALTQSTNDYRSRSGKPALRHNMTLDRAAQAKAESMIAGNYWSHTAPDGTTPWYYFQKVGYNYRNAGENLAYGFATSDQVVTAWMNSHEHRDNILGDYADVGFGFANGTSYQHGHNTVIVAFYGTPSDQKSLPGVSDTQKASGPTATVAQHAQQINGASTIASGNAPWAAYADLALIGASILGVLTAHLEAIRLGWHKTKRYAMLHPAIDVVVLFGFVAMIVQAVGGFIR